MAQLNFDATTVAPDEGRDFAALPAGDYPVLIEASEVKENQKRTGFYLELTHQVIDGPHKGRKLFDTITMTNRTSADAERIGRAQLSALCHAVGILRVQDSAELHNRPYLASVKIEPAKGEYAARNKVTARKPLGGAPCAAAPAMAPAAAPAAAPAWGNTQAAAPQQQATAAAAPAANAAPPWASR